MTIVTEQCADIFRDSITPVAGWFVSVGHPLVQQRFYAAIDTSGSLCWTDDPTIAEQFPLRQDAECFARLACLDEDWSVDR
ncbi:hypothetical protein P7D22_00355 [Lichenihabitans sp. Uapishka_5]|uniref:hypothetical protein n=1 Tax=Lichenihabitans sp. Uapishka_5 TaxID=3037302 RepID=UPI0029E80EBB|nr:hypothetical protein [Lichenihabitans sp. Uapishka_5]MDX7949627.1 hypothetical protein [Lichenihabitans sp. Uapishka_5]